MNNFEKLYQLLTSQDLKNIEVGLQIAQNNQGFEAVKSRLESLFGLPNLEHFGEQFFADDRRTVDLELLLASRAGKLSMAKIFEQVPGMVGCLPFEGQVLPVNYTVHSLEFESHEFSNLEGLIEQAYFEVENIEAFYEVIKTDETFDEIITEEIDGYEEDELKDFYNTLVLHYWGTCSQEAQKAYFTDAFCKKHRWHLEAEATNLLGAFQAMSEVEGLGNELVTSLKDTVCDAFSEGFAFGKLFNLLPENDRTNSEIVLCEAIPMEAHHSEDSFTLLLAHY